MRLSLRMNNRTLGIALEKQTPRITGQVQSENNSAPLCLSVNVGIMFSTKRRRTGHCLCCSCSRGAWGFCSPRPPRGHQLPVVCCAIGSFSLTFHSAAVLLFPPSPAAKALLPLGCFWEKFTEWPDFMSLPWSLPLPLVLPQSWRRALPHSISLWILSLHLSFGVFWWSASPGIAIDFAPMHLGPPPECGSFSQGGRCWGARTGRMEVSQEDPQWQLWDMITVQNWTFCILRKLTEVFFKLLWGNFE